MPQQGTLACQWTSLCVNENPPHVNGYGRGSVCQWTDQGITSSQRTYLQWQPDSYLLPTADPRPIKPIPQQHIRLLPLINCIDQLYWLCVWSESKCSVLLYCIVY